MRGDRDDAESEVSDNQTTIPVQIRRELGIEDGDRLQWRLENTGDVRVRVVQRHRETFDDFDGYAGTEETDVTVDHDAWSVGNE